MFHVKHWDIFPGIATPHTLGSHGKHCVNGRMKNVFSGFSYLFSPILKGYSAKIDDFVDTFGGLAL